MARAQAVMLRWHEARGEAIPGLLSRIAGWAWQGGRAAGGPDWWQSVALALFLGGDHFHRVWSKDKRNPVPTPTNPIIPTWQSTTSPRTFRKTSETTTQITFDASFPTGSRFSDTGRVLHCTSNAGHLPTYGTSINEHNGEHSRDGLSGVPPQGPANVG